MKIAEFLDLKNRGRKIKMFVAQEYRSGISKHSKSSSFYWRAFFDIKSFSPMIRDEHVKQDFVEIVSVKNAEHNKGHFSLTLKYMDEVFEHFEPCYDLAADRIELNGDGKITASYFTTWSDIGSSDKFKNKVIWQEQ